MPHARLALVAAILGGILAGCSGDRPADAPAPAPATGPVSAAPATGAFPPAIAAWGEPEKEAQRQAAALLVKDLHAAIARGERRFTVPPGDYRFGGKDLRNLVLKDVRGLEIEATGATFWFVPLVGIDGIVLQGCKDVAVRGLTVDYDPCPYSQGEILAIDPATRTLQVRIDPGFPMPYELAANPGTAGGDPPDRKGFAGGNSKAVFFDPRGVMRAMMLDWSKELQPLGGRDLRVSLAVGRLFTMANEVAVGDRMVFPDRSKRMVLNLAGCEGMAIEDCTFYAAPHMVFSEGGGKGGNAYRRNAVTRRPGTGRLLACNADIFHSIKVDRGPIIEDNDWGYTCDDIANVHTFFSPVLKASGSATEAVVVNFFGADIEPGCELEFFRYRSFMPLGKAKVLAVTPLPELQAEGRALPAELRRQGQDVFDFIGRYCMPLRVTLDAPVATGPYDVAVSSLAQARGTVFRRNHFHDGHASGVHLKCDGGLVEDNRIERTGGPGILLAAELAFWEAPFPRGITVRGNRLSECGFYYFCRTWFNGMQASIAVLIRGEKHAYAAHPTMPMSGIRIEGNTIDRSPPNGIFLSNARNTEVRGNLFTAPGFLAPVEGSAVPAIRDNAFTIYTTFTSGTVIEGNRHQDPAPCNRGLVGIGPGAEDAGPQQ